ncbi:MAG TPA: hypothetical protein VFV38_03240 [Ktedonobacteraceae bacterium]|nr:hypothetical protein [Ktedonobacteraceae bacterium]
MSTLDVIHVGIKLIQQGWMQGSLLRSELAPKLYTVQTLVSQEMTENIEISAPLISNQWKTKEVTLDENDLLVIVSQVCDIQKAPDKEPYVEAVRAYWTNERDIIHQAKRNSIYYFPLRERNVSNNRKEALIVDLRHRLLIEKESLSKCQPESYFDEENTVTPRRFRQWLGRRYLRQALENELVIAIQQPVVNGIRKLSSGDPLHDTLDSLREIRFFLLNETAPYQIEMLFLFDGDSEKPPFTYEEAARLGNWMDVILKSEGKIASYTWQWYSTQAISVYDYENAYELPLHEFSLP